MNELPIRAALSARRFALMIGMVAIIGGCSDPKCPHGSEKLGSRCRLVGQDDDPSTARDASADGDDSNSGSGSGGEGNNGDAEANGSSGADANGAGPSHDGGSGADQDGGGTGTMCSVELCNAQDDDCDTVIDESCMESDDCASLPCKNGGTCTDGQDTFECACPPGFEGKACETNIDDCASNPCLNGGKCTDGANTFMCTCASGYQGERCEIANDDCDPNPCRNGGTCADVAMGGVKCTCAAGYSGAQCEINIDDCAPNPCLNGGTCKDGVNAHTCTCPAGYSGANCETNINDCAPNPCQNGGTCKDGINTHTCTCPTGTRGANCEQTICGDVKIRSRADIDANRNCAEMNSLSLAISGFAAIAETDFPYLTKVNGSLTMSAGFVENGPSAEIPQSVTFSALETVGGDLLFSGTAVKEIRFPKLREVRREWRFDAIGARLLDFPAMTTIGASTNGGFEVVYIYDAPDLCTLHVHSVSKIVGGLAIAFAGKLPTADIAPLVRAVTPGNTPGVEGIGCCYAPLAVGCEYRTWDPNGPECKCE